MSELYLLTVIAGRNHLSSFLKVHKENNLSTSFIALARGSARNDLLSAIGLDAIEKAVIFSIVTRELWQTIKKCYEKQVKIDLPNVGIAFIVALSSIGGKRELAFLTDGQDFEKGEEQFLKETKRELIVAVSNQGYNDQVMDAARSAGASGGTVIHAKGTGMEKSEQFFGITLASEKDLIFIVTPTVKKKAIMSEIMQQAGLDTKAKTIVFSLPVTDAVGLRLEDFDDENE